MITNPKQTIGTVHTKVGPAQLLHCYKHPRNVAIALSCAPMLHPEMTYDEWSEEEWHTDLEHKFYVHVTTDRAKLLRMISAMGICSECVQNAIISNLLWTRFIYISQRVKNWQTNEEISHGAFSNNGETDFFEQFSGVHTIGHSIELSFVGQIKSTIEYFCPTCFVSSYSKLTLTTGKLSGLLNIPQDSLSTNILTQAGRNL